MIVTVVNSLAIICGSLLGLTMGRGIHNRYRQTVMQALGMAVILIGLKSALQTNDLLLVIVSLAIGSLVGEMIGVEERLNSLALRLERFVAGGATTDLARGFVTASLAFCVGAMAIVGSLESGLAANHQTLFAKSILDGIISLVFAATMGLGVIFSAVSVFLYQGAITLMAGMLQPLLTPSVISQMTGVGGILIAGIGLNLLDNKSIKVGNMLPSMMIPPVYFALKQVVVLWS